MKIRRCHVVLIEPRESVEFDLVSLTQGGDGLRRARRWLALAPHLAEEVEVDADERDLLGELPVAQWCDWDALVERHGRDVLVALLDKGLLIGDGPVHAAIRGADDKLRATHWRPLSAAFHFFGRWRGVDSGQDRSEIGLGSFRDMVNTLGDPPPHFGSRGDPAARVALPKAPQSAMDELLSSRVTCRNWDASRWLDQARFSHLLFRVFGAQAVFQAADQAWVVKKTSPSGGGLHPIEAYLLVRRVEGVPPGLYHYHAGEHALEPLPWPEALVHALATRHRQARQAEDGSTGDGRDQLMRDFGSALLAGQHWFGEAQVLVFLTARFRRQTWKYRAHAKAYKALLLDAGHLSQTLYLTAAELGLGAFITAAVNDAEIEEALGTDAQEEGLIAVNGFGWRGDTRETVEFDPLRKVWADWGAGSGE